MLHDIYLIISKRKCLTIKCYWSIHPAAYSTVYQKQKCKNFEKSRENYNLDVYAFTYLLLASHTYADSFKMSLFLFSSVFSRVFHIFFFVIRNKCVLTSNNIMSHKIDFIVNNIFCLTSNSTFSSRNMCKGLVSA